MAIYSALRNRFVEPYYPNIPPCSRLCATVTAALTNSFSDILVRANSSSFYFRETRQN